MLHLDLFSGIGGFALAVDKVWDGVEHIFVDNDKFCQKVLKKHWPNSQIYGDIRTFTYAKSKQNRRRKFRQIQPDITSKVDLLTGGFPCQPFSQAGKRKGTSDDRFLWPEMLRVIQEFQPTWIIAENVRGILTIEQGMVFQQVCTDLEASGYEVQPLIIPACAVNAPHRRDRVWFVAYRTSGGQWNGKQARNTSRQSKKKTGNGNRNSQSIGYSQHNGLNVSEDEKSRVKRSNNNTTRQNENEQSTRPVMARNDAQNSISKRSRGRSESSGQILGGQISETQNERPSWEKNWIEVATRLCGMDDEFSEGLDFAGFTKAQHRIQRLKSLGNAIVPAVAIEIMKAIKYAENYKQLVHKVEELVRLEEYPPHTDIIGA